jgi:CheY-like chemotaxis protein
MAQFDFGKCSYLVVDDDDLSQAVVGNALGRIGASQIYYAQDGSAAYRLAKQHRPDFILLDIYMPDVDGWTLLPQLRQAAPSAVVVMVTGSNRPADFLQSMDDQADGFCIKPVVPDVMEKALLNARQRQQSQRH